MKPSDADSILLIPSDLEKLERFVEPLNTEFFRLRMPNIPFEGRWNTIKKDYRPVQRELRRLVQAWRDSGPNIRRLFETDPVLADAARRFPSHMIATEGPTARLVYVTVPENMNPGEPLEIALGLFLDFLLNPFNVRLGGPCAHCGKYFLRKNKRHGRYCTERCGQRQTALAVNRKRRAREYAEKLQSAQESTARWAKSRARTDWKEWVAKETTISKNWLTRAVGIGELSVPTKSISQNRR